MSVVESPGRLIDWGVASRPYPGQRVCGDAALIAPFEGGVLVGVIDGLGHGEEAALASREAVASLERMAGGPLREAVGACHEALRRTRGAALSLAQLRPAMGVMSWIGVGNVEAVLFRARSGAGRETIVPRAGVVGYQMPPLREATLSTAPGDLLILASDGITSRFYERPPRAATPEAMAREVLNAHGRPDDDALVLVVHVLEGAP
jgi:hypothetical protein